MYRGNFRKNYVYVMLCNFILALNFIFPLFQTHYKIIHYHNHNMYTDHNDVIFPNINCLT